MPQFEVGQRVMYVANPRRRGEVIFVHGLMGGQQYYDIRRDDGGQETKLEQDLQVEVATESAWDRLALNLLGSYDSFAIATTLHKVKNTTNNTISSLRASRTLFKAYQYKPLVKFLQSDSKRILVADEVGLGKTIEAGHIMLELRGRKLLRNALVVCPKSLGVNWQTELREKFNFEFKLYHTVTDFASDISHDINTARRSIFGIVNYEKLRSPQIQNLFTENSYFFDLLVCDESHRLRNSDTQLFAAFKNIVQQAEAIVFLTATPIMLGEQDLFNQIRLLEEKQYPNLEMFQNAINQNRPFVRALNQLNRGVALSVIASELHQAEVNATVTIGDEFQYEHSDTVQNLFRDDPLYERARKSMINGPDTPELRAQVQYDLSELNTLNHLFTRTRKRHVLTDTTFAERNSHRITIDLSDHERDLYDEVAHRYGGLEVIQRKRMVTSSIVAYHSSSEMLGRGEYCRDIPDSKFDAFKKIVDRVVIRAGKKVLVFSTFIKTLTYLEIRLREMGIGSTMIHGQVDDRSERINRFRTDSSIRVLLSSEVGREGLNLQFCDVLVNYDLPWNPMTVEQRIGRIDRIGQESKVVNIYSFTIRDTIEERIHERLLERIDVFRNALGDLEEILSEDHTLVQQIETLEQTLYRTELTEEEQIERIDQVATAFETERLNLVRIEEELTDAIVNDIHFRNEIDRIVKNRRYLTEIELRRFVESTLRVALPTHDLEPRANGQFVIRIPNNDREALFDFIEEYKDDGEGNPEIEVLYRKFKRRFWAENEIAVTFSQDFAYRDDSDSDSVFVNSYHPIINAAANYFERNALHLNQAYRVAIRRDDLDEDVLIDPGHYVLAVYKVVVEKTAGGRARHSAYLHAAMVDLNGDVPCLVNEETAARLFGLVQQTASAPNDLIPFTPELVAIIRTPIAMEIVRKQRETEEDEKVRLHSSRRRRQMQLKQFYENQIQRRRQLLAEGRGIRDIIMSDIERLESEMRRDLNEIDALDVSCSNEIVSVNHLEVL